LTSRPAANEMEWKKGCSRRRRGRSKNYVLRKKGEKLLRASGVHALVLDGSKQRCPALTPTVQIVMFAKET